MYLRHGESRPGSGPQPARHGRIGQVLVGLQSDLSHRGEERYPEAALQIADEAFDLALGLSAVGLTQARQEASVSFEATLQVRNKLLSAYQDIMRMGV